MKLFLKGLKWGFYFNICVTLFLVSYVFIIENWLSKPLLGKFSPPLQLGTVVDYHRLFAADPPSMQLRKSWLNIQDKFSYFIIEYQLRSDYTRPSPRLFKWCKFKRRCVAHRINYFDSRKNQFRFFTLDDWFANYYLSLRGDKDFNSQLLNLFFRSLPSGSVVVISEPFSVFSKPATLYQFFDWILVLRSDYPHLKFEIGLQIHLQWVDAYWFKSQWIIPELQKFFKTSGVSWGISEFSIYDQIWKRRLRDDNFRDRPFYKIEQLVPRRLRRAIVLHSSYVIHRTAAENGAIRFTEWGNSQRTAWFVAEIDSLYDSNYELFTLSGTPTPLWWAGLRGLRDAQK
jgi:hypothetical protein